MHAALVCLTLVCCAAEDSAAKNTSNTLGSTAPYWKALREVQYEPTGDDLLDGKRAVVARTMLALDQYLQGGGQYISTGWKSYLHWGNVQAELNSDKPDPSVLARTFLNLRCNQSGLERPPFVAVRESLRDYLETVRYTCPVDPKAAFEAHKSQLAELLARYEKHPTRQDAHAIGDILGCLERSGPSARRLIAAIRDEFDRPNVHIRVSNDFISYLLHFTFDESEPFRRTNDRMTTRGITTTKGFLRGQIAPNSERALIDCQIIAQTRAPRTVSTTGPVTVYGSFLTDLTASKKLFVDANGVSFLPTSARGATAIQINNIQAARRIIERIAWRRADRQRPEMELETSREAERKFSNQIDKETESGLRGANGIYVRELREPMLRYGAFPNTFRCSTTENRLHMLVKLAKSVQLAAPDRLPRLDERHDLAFAVHASFFENYAAMALADKTIVDRQWLAFMNILTGNQPRTLWVHDRSKPWSLRFASVLPITLVMDKGRFTVTIHGAKLRRGDLELDRPFTVAATFGAKFTEEGPALVRHGDVSVELADGSLPQNDNERALLAFVHRKLNGVMQPSIHFDGFVPPAGSRFAKLRNVKVKEFDFQRDWVTIGYQLAIPDPEAVASSTE